MLTRSQAAKNKIQGSQVYKRPMPLSPGKPTPTRQEQLSLDLGLSYEDSNGHGSLSSDEEDNVLADSSENSVPAVKYHAQKRQLKHMEQEREGLLLKISKLKEKTKLHERQLQKEESDRKNQLNIMKNTHEQAFSDKNRTINLYQTIVREQEVELDELRKQSQSEGVGTYVEGSISERGVAITRLSTQLNHVTQEKNDILAQFFSQQSLIKQQQLEIKGLIRCKSENADLQVQTSTLNKTVNNLSKQAEGEKRLMQEEINKLEGELENLKLSSQKTPNKTVVAKLEESNTKLQDKLLRKEAEYAEMDLQRRQDLKSLTEESSVKDEVIQDLKQQLLRHNSLPAVEKVVEVQVESEASKLKVAALEAEKKQLTESISKLKLNHENNLSTLQSQNKESLDKLQKDLANSRKEIQELNSVFQSQNEKEAELKQSHQLTVKQLEQQVKDKNSELNSLRQTMADKVVELENCRDVDLEELENRLKLSMADTSSENERLRRQLASVLPQVSWLRNECRQLHKLCQELEQLHLAQSTSVSEQVTQAIRDVSEHNKDLVRKYRKEMALRKKYHNELVELKGNIRVFCRVRPVIKEDGASPHTVLSAHPDDEDVLMVENSKGRSQSFEMDRLFTPSVSQQQVFKDVQALVTSCVDGYHVCIFAYGQTGSGKTHTMEGRKSDPGINQRALIQLFEEAEERSKDWTYDIQVAVIEIYNESVRDLLSSDPSDKLDIKHNQEGHLHVPGLSWVGVSNVEDVNRTFSVGHRNRATASTNMNEHSSRSHALLCVEVTGINRTTGAKTFGKLNLVDLAGSERVSKSGADGARLKETQAINKSLSALGDVIAALRSKQTFVPYRNSKLTYLLQDSLGGDSKVLMIVQVAPVEYHVSETLCSLNFAQRVKSVELGMANKKVENAEISALKGRLAQYEGSSPLSTPTKSGTPQGTPLRRKLQ